MVYGISTTTANANHLDFGCLRNVFD